MVEYGTYAKLPVHKSLGRRRCPIAELQKHIEGLSPRDKKKTPFESIGWSRTPNNINPKY